MISRSGLKTILSRSAHNKGSLLKAHATSQQKRFYSSFNDNNKDGNDKSVKSKMQQQPSKKNCTPPDIPSFMPVVNIPEAELAHNAFYSLHRPLLGLSIPRPFLVGGIVGQIKEDKNDCKLHNNCGNRKKIY